jgi:chromate transporter
MKEKVKVLLKLFSVFFKIGAVSFGGGYAMLPLLEREVVTKRGWTTQDTLYDYYAIGQCTPGVIMVNVATFIGWTQGGVLGSAAATTGIVTPSLIIISAIASFLQNFADIALVQKAFGGINVAVAALLTKALFDFGKKTITNIVACIIFVASFTAILFFKVNSNIVIFAGAAAGIAYNAIKTRITARRAKEKNDDAV